MNEDTTYWNSNLIGSPLPRFNRIFVDMLYYIQRKELIVMEGKLISIEVFALIVLAAGIVGYFLSAAIRVGIRLPMAALAILALCP